jgi:CRISPR/Cas system-associated endonuclease Cas1
LCNGSHFEQCTQSRVKSGSLLLAQPDYNRKFFSGEQKGIDPNNLLNYSAAILWVIRARSLFSSGILPTYGISHRSKNNTKDLADDLTKLYHSYVDLVVPHSI